MLESERWLQTDSCSAIITFVYKVLTVNYLLRDLSVTPSLPEENEFFFRVLVSLEVSSSSFMVSFLVFVSQFVSQ